MKCAAIISEYNPFHNGHKYQIDLLRRAGYDVIIAVMSGSVVQRGEIAIVDKFTRAKSAVMCGVDLVCELPAPFSCTSGEYFARAGVIAADALGADVLSFGSECGDIDLLCAHATERHIAKPSVGAASAELSGTSFSSNDILAIEYIRAIKRIGSGMKPITHLRKGGGYNSDVPDTEYSSATAIRKAINDGRAGLIGSQMPSESFELMKDALNKCSESSVSDSILSAVMLWKFRTTDLETLSSYAFMNGGLASRMKKAAEKATTADELYALSATKVYTNSRIRRAAICTVCQIPDSIRDTSPEYLSLLCANEKGRNYLSSHKTSLPVLTTVRAKKEFESFEYEKRLDMLFELVKKYSDAKHLYTLPPVML